MYYFFSYTPCALKINGNFKAIISLNLFSVTLNECDFIELIPLGEFLPITFTLNNPDKKIKRLCSFCGDFIFPLCFNPQPKPYKVLLSHNFTSYSVKVEVENQTKLLLQTKTETFIENLPFYPNTVSVFYNDNRYIALLFSLNKQILLVKDVTNGETVLNCSADEFYQNNGELVAKNIVPSVLNHTVFYRYSTKQSKREISRQISPNELNPKLFSYAFLECVSLNDDLSDFLLDGMQKDKISAFLGDFNCIFPCPNEKYDFVLVGENLKFVKVEILDGKICNLITS